MVVRNLCRIALLSLWLLSGSTLLHAEDNQPLPPLFLLQRVSNNSPFIGERIFYTLELHSKIPIKIPRLQIAFDAFSDHAAIQETRDEVENGAHYTVISLRSVLYPEVEGSVSIDSQKIELSQILAEKTLDSAPLVLESSKLELSVKPLPPLPEQALKLPPSQILVGATTLEVHADRSAINLGEARTIGVLLRSQADLSSFLYQLQGTGGISIYENPARLSKDPDTSRFQFQKRFSYSVLPQKEGRLKVSCGSLWVFDPDKGSYSSINPSVLEFNVRRPARSSTASVAASSAAGPEQSSTPAKETLRYHEANAMEQLLGSFSVSSFLLICTSVMLAVATVYVHIRVRRKLRASTPAYIDEIRDAGSLSDLHRAFRTALLSAANSPQENSGLKEIIKDSIPESGLRIRAETLLHELAAEIYSRKQPSATKMKHLRQRALRITTEVAKAAEKLRSSEHSITTM